jgi:hypothetical protein
MIFITLFFATTVFLELVDLSISNVFIYQLMAPSLTEYETT